MDTLEIINSYMAVFVTQALLHSITAAIIVDRSIQAWKITNPKFIQRFRLIVIILPVVSFPLYQVINPERGSVYFRVSALFDSGRWLSLKIVGIVPAGIVIVAVISLTALIFIFQELIPILRQIIESRRSEMEWDRLRADSEAGIALGKLSTELPAIFVSEDDDMMIYSATGKKPAVYVSTGLMKELDLEQTKAAVAHEIAHIRRSRLPLLILTYLIRVLMFFNPVTLMEFRRIVQEEEKICDDIAVGMMGGREALAGALSKMMIENGMEEHDVKPRRSKMIRSLIISSHNMLLESRVERLANSLEDVQDDGWIKFAVTLVMIMGLNYLVV